MEKNLLANQRNMDASKNGTRMKSVLHPTHKKLTQSDCQNYSDMAQLNVIYKNRLAKKVDIEEN